MTGPPVTVTATFILRKASMAKNQHCRKAAESTFTVVKYGFEVTVQRTFTSTIFQCYIELFT